MNVFDLLTIVFAICKILGYLDWSWRTVLMPSIIFYGGMLVMYVLALIFASIKD